MLRSALLAILVLLSLYGLSHLLTPSMRAHSFWQTPLAVVALQGGLNEQPDNSRLAMQASVDAGVHSLWLPLQVTNDQHLVVNADRSVDRISNGTGDVHAMSLAQLRGLDIGYWWPYHDPQDVAKLYVPTQQNFPHRGRGLQMQTLDDLQQSFAQQAFILDLGDATPELRRSLAVFLSEHQRWGSTLLWVNNSSSLNELRRLFPQAQTYASEAELRLFYFMQLLKLEHLYPHRPTAFLVNSDAKQEGLLTPGFVAAATRLGMGVHVLGQAPSEQQLSLWRDLGVQGIVTGQPRAAQQWLATGR